MVFNARTGNHLMLHMPASCGGAGVLAAHEKGQAPLAQVPQTMGVGTRTRRLSSRSPPKQSLMLLREAFRGRSFQQREPENLDHYMEFDSFVLSGGMCCDPS